MKKWLPLVYLTAITLWLRLANLGYSDYQGDEIKALYPGTTSPGLVEFLLDRKKGPVQFLVTFFLHHFDADYSQRFLVRFPFAVAGVLAIFVFYRFVEFNYNRKIAIYASIFLSLNGLTIAFSRIVQYQSFVILFSILALYFLSLSVKDDRWQIRGLYAAAICWGVAILSHYDGIFIAPAAIYFLYQWYVRYQPKNLYRSHLLYSAIVCFITVAIFYIPFFLATYESTFAYLSDRVTGDSDQNSIVLFQTYNPDIFFYLYLFLAIAVLTKFKRYGLMWLWFAFPFVAMEFVISQQRTHIYTYLLPGCILVAAGLEIVEDRTRNWVPKWFKIAIVSATFLFASLFSHTVYIDSSREYPWESKPFLFWTLPKTHIDGLFGFPYSRHWQEIDRVLQKNSSSGYYLTNEKGTIAEFNLSPQFQRLDEDDIDDIDDRSSFTGDKFVIYIRSPQKFEDEILNKSRDYWRQHYDAIATFSNRDRVVVEIYQIGDRDWWHHIDLGKSPRNALTENPILIYLSKS